MINKYKEFYLCNKYMYNCTVIITYNYYDKQCGLITNPNTVKDFSEEFKREYDIDLNSITVIIPNYSNIFEEIFHITGDIFSIQLNRKTPNIDYSETNSIILYLGKNLSIFECNILRNTALNCHETD